MLVGLDADMPKGGLEALPDTELKSME